MMETEQQPGGQKIENNETQASSPETGEKEISNADLSTWADTQEEKFKNETNEEMGRANSVNLPESDFENLKKETDIESQLKSIDDEAASVVAGVKSEAPENKAPSTAEAFLENATSFIEADPRYAAMKKELNDKRIQELIKTETEITRSQRISDMTIAGYSDKSYNPELEKTLWNLEFSGRIRMEKDGTFSTQISPNEINNEFAKRYPDEYKVYEAKEKTRVYENYLDDPAYLQTCRDAFDVYGQNHDKAWSDFVERYPEKAAAYQKNNEHLDKVLTRKNKNTNQTEPQNRTAYSENISDAGQGAESISYEEKTDQEKGSPENNSEKNLESTVHIEVVEKFKEMGLPLDFELEGMLDEETKHQGGRRGSGFTQASRYFADRIRSPRSDADLRMFDPTVSSRLDDEAFEKESKGETKPEKLTSLLPKEKLLELEKNAKNPASKLAVSMMLDILEVSAKDKNVKDMPVSRDKIKIGTCTTAENYFFEYMRGHVLNQAFESGDARMNIILDDSGEPLFMEKTGGMVGEEHSAISLKPTYINGVKIPAGSLIALEYGQKEGEKKQTSSRHGSIMNISDIKAVEFLRFTTLVAEPKDREKMFGKHFEWQKENKMPGAEDLRLEDLITKCKSEVLSS